MAKEATPGRREPEHSLPLSMADQVRLAEARGWQAAYEAHRAHVFSERGVPVFATRGKGDCLALVLLPLGLILLAVHPLPAFLVLVVVGWLVLSGSDRLREDRRAIAAADAAALRLWLAAGHPPPSPVLPTPAAPRPLHRRLPGGG
ncbi:MAG: hypothetical protein ACKOZT_12485 [Cyanobium sp.]